MTLVHRFVLSIASLLAVAGLGAVAGPPTWAYPTTPSRLQPVTDDKEKHRLPGSTRDFTFAEVNDPFTTADWYPAEHTLMPELVARGRRPNVRPCASCHLP